MSEEPSEIINEALGLLTGEMELKEKFLRNLNELQRTRLSLIEREMDSLRYSDENDQRLNILEENIQGGKQLVKAIRNQLEIGAISVPKLKEGQAIVHGRIIDENGNGKVNCEVSLVVEGEAINIVGKSDQSGYYSIVLPLPVVKKMEGKDFEIYIRTKGFLIDKSPNPIKLEGQVIKYEPVIDSSKIKNVNTQGKAGKVGRKTRKPK